MIRFIGLSMIVLLAGSALGFAQAIRTVGVLPFEVNEGASAAQAAEATGLVVAMLGTSQTLSINTGAQAENSEFIVRGQISGADGQIVLTATIENAAGNVMNTARSQAASLGAISMFAFCIQLADFIPFPNYMIGRWESTVQMIDGPVTAILDFRPGGVVIVEKYETWEHSGVNSLKYQAIGTGTYSFFGHHLRRTISVGGQSIQPHASLNINLNLEDALPDFLNISATGLMLVFNETRGAFELVTAGLPFGNNLSGPAVHPNQRIYHRTFTRL